MNILIKNQFWLIVNNVNFVWIHFYVVLINNEFQKFDLIYIEFAFFKFYIKFVFKKLVKYDFYMFFVFFQNFRKYQNIINVNQRENVEIFTKCYVNIILKNCENIYKFKWHNTIFIMFVSRTKHNFSFVVFFYLNHIINDNNVKFCEIFDFDYFIYNFVDKW